MTWTVRLRSHAEIDAGRILESAAFEEPAPAMDAYRAMLGRADLLGQPVAAVFKPPVGFDGTRANVSTFFSRFDVPVGAGRIDPRDPRLDPLLSRAEADRIAQTPPPAGMAPHDWEADPRPLRDCLHEWRARSGWTWEQVAGELRTPLPDLKGWMKGDEPPSGAALRRMMALIDRVRGIGL